MSTDSKGEQARFYSAAADPGRARPLERLEYQAAVEALHATVTPILEKAAGRLKTMGYPTVEVEGAGAMVSLITICPRAGVKGTLRFQVHETFAVLVARDPVFWMFSLFNGSDMITAKPGRLPGLENVEPVEGIVEDFVAACELGIRSRTNEVSAYLLDVITCALDGAPLRPPAPTGEMVRFSTCGDKAYLSWAVVPALEAARICVDRRLQAWSAKVFSPGTGDDAQCGMLITTRMGKGLLRFTRKISATDNPLLCYQITMAGTTFPTEPLEIVTNESGHFVAAEALDTIIGEFIYGLMMEWSSLDDL